MSLSLQATSSCAGAVRAEPRSHAPSPACEVEREARRAGVDAYLRKPHGVYGLAGLAARLLARQTVKE